MWSQATAAITIPNSRLTACCSRRDKGAIPTSSTSPIHRRNWSRTIRKEELEDLLDEAEAAGAKFRMRYPENGQDTMTIALA